MSDVKRYDVTEKYIGTGEYVGAMVESATGDWVEFSDYDALKARLEALEATLTDLASPDFMAKYRKLKRDAARLAEATAFGVECQRALEISRDRLAEAERIVRAVDKVGAEAVANGGRITLTQGAVLFTAAANYLVKHHSAADSEEPAHE